MLPLPTLPSVVLFPNLKKQKLFTCNLRSILVRTTRYPIHPATCTRPWRASLRIAWVPCQLGSLHNAKKSTSAMSSSTTTTTTIQQSIRSLAAIHSFLENLSLLAITLFNLKSNQYQWVLLLFTSHFFSLYYIDISHFLLNLPTHHWLLWL